MIKIDGSFGEGGGQIVRSSLCLSALTGVPVTIENIRARRPRPGLANQHLAAARALAKVCGAEMEGAKKGSTELVFRPGEIRAGHYSREIGSAGSTTLIFQTLFPVLSRADRESGLTLHGGTHNPMAPPSDFLSECFLPAAEAAGFDAEVELVRHGFYPEGGGAIRARVRPFSPPAQEFDLSGETEWEGPEVTILITNLPEHVAFREQDEVAKSLKIDPISVDIEALPGEVGPGNAVMIRYRADGRTALFTSFGEPGKKAERVARQGAREAKNFRRSRASVDPHLADQLVLVLALGKGGCFSTSEITEHLRTHAKVIRDFLDCEIGFETVKSDFHVVTVPGTSALI